MPDDLRVRPDLVIPGDELRERASRASGPGGQHVNKTSTRVTLRWNVACSAALSERQRARLRKRLATRLTQAGVLAVSAGASRSQARNREAARERLAALVREGLAVARPRRPTRPSKASREARLTSKRHRSRVKRERGPPAADD